MILLKKFYRHACIVLFGCALSALSYADTCQTACTDGSDCIAAALYPYVPNVAVFRESACSAWESQGNSTSLYLITDYLIWDGGYKSDPVYINGSGNSVPIDVFVYDAMYLEYWKTQTSPIPMASITNPSDFLSYTKAQLNDNDVAMYALPVLGCTNIMFYQSSDQNMAEVETLKEFMAVNPAGVFTSPVPFNRTGAMMSMSGSTTAGVDYMVAGYLQNGRWPSMTSIEPAVVDLLQGAASTSSFYNALTNSIPPPPDGNNDYLRAIYFSEGYGRTSISFSESMSQMSADTRGQISLKAFPPSNNPAASSMFFADVAGINNKSPFLTSQQNTVYSLVNLLASQSVTTNSINPTGGELQYLFPARKSVLQTLAANDKLYQQMSDILTARKTELVVMPTTDRALFSALGSSVVNELRVSFTGACDIDTNTLISSQGAANQTCPSLCANNGGWNGQWTPKSPPAWPGYSACGCNTCNATSPVPNTHKSKEKVESRYLRN